MNNNWLTIEQEGQRVILKKCVKEAEGEIIIPEGVTDIAQGAFGGCHNVSNVIIPNSVETIGIGAFIYCGISSIHIPTNVKEIAQAPAFEDKFAPFPFYGNHYKSITVDPNNRYYDSRENCNAIIETATNRLITASSKTIIPESVKIIGNGAFFCTGHKKIDIPNGIEAIESFAFYYCKQLPMVIIPPSVTFIGDCAFDEYHTKIIKKDSSMSIVDYIIYRGLPEFNEDWPAFFRDLFTVFPEWRDQLKSARNSSLLLHKLGGVASYTLFYHELEEYLKEKGLPQFSNIN